MRVPLLKQKKNECGLTALRMVLEYFGKNITENSLRKITGKTKSYGFRTVKLSEAVKKIGFKTECLSYNKKLAGSKAKIEKPKISEILKYLKRKVPVILSVRSSLLYNEKFTKEGTL